MALSIKGEEADKLARQVAALTGENITEAVTESLRERLDRLEKEKRVDKTVQEVLAISRAFRREMEKSGESFSSTDHGDMFYDEFGLPK
jgi:antitoxin VapB